METQLNKLANLINRDYPKLSYTKVLGGDDNPPVYSITIYDNEENPHTTKEYEKKQDAFNEAVIIIQHINL
jgi:ABC-type molybdate transport system substrate-binding protein